MRPPSLLRRLSWVLVGVVVFTGTLLAVVTTLTATVLLRRAQDREIRTTTAQLARAIALRAGPDWSGADRTIQDVFEQLQVEGLRFEWVGGGDQVIASVGDVPDWVSSRYGALEEARGEEPIPLERLAGPGGFRAWAMRCGPDRTIRVVARDVLTTPEVRRVTIARLIALPVAVVFGVFVGVALIRKQLRPLQQLEDAASGLEPRPGMTLGVGAAPSELRRLEAAFDGLLKRLGDALNREKRFSADASHELRTPLTILRGRIETLTHGTSAPPEVEARCRAILKEIDALDVLVDALLLLSRSESAPLPEVPVNVCDLARETARRQSLADGPASPEPQVDAPDEILVAGSEELLARALGNLVENARKFSGPSGLIRIGARQERGLAILSVSDNGPGIPDEQRRRVFDRFYRGPDQHAERSGAGLGLAVARAVVARHRGAISIGRADLGGAELTIELPLMKFPAEAPAGPS